MLNPRRSVADLTLSAWAKEVPAGVGDKVSDGVTVGDAPVDEGGDTERVEGEVHMEEDRDRDTEREDGDWNGDIEGTD